MASSFLWLIPVVIFIVIIVLILVLYFSTPSRKNFSFQKRHALITGGSKGIGKQLAKELLSRGCNVSIVARNKTDLEKTCEELQTLADQRSFGQKVRWFSCDLTKGYENIESVIRKAETELGPVEILINNAGHSVQAPFADLPVGDFESQMQVNYLSAVYATRAVVENMKERRSGHISFVSSAAGQCAIFGYSAYSPTKFALRGFADSLHMELLPYKINVAVLYPPNTDTEGFKLELTTMPEETMLISDSAGLFTPEEVAKSHCNDIEAGNYATAIGLDGWMLSVLTAGASPEKSLGRVLVQICLAGLFRGIMLCYLGYFNGIVKKCHIRRKNAQEESPDNMPKEKDVSTRLIRPTIANIDVNRLMLFVARYDQNWELDASIQIYDEGIAQYMLTDAESHYKYLSALILGKASLRCRLTPNEPEDILDESGNTITLENLESLTVEDQKRLDYLQNILGARGFRFVH